ncbi:MAG: tetratricopeptide repeat protein, partial [Oscillospiraceae bacterium]
MFNSNGGISVPAGMSADDLFKNAKRFQQNGQMREAIAYYTAVANMGSAEAQIDLGIVYTGQFGVAANYPEAERLFTLAANQGNPIAMYNLGFFYENTYSPPQYDRAFNYYLMAANRDYCDAFFKVAVYYINGWGTRRNADAAQYWNVRGLIDGDAAGCCNNIGFMCENGIGTESNPRLAKTWYRLGAEKGFQAAADNYNRLFNVQELSQHECENAKCFYGTLYSAYCGDADMQCRMGRTYINGDDCCMDHPLGLYWLRRAAAENHSTAALWLGRMYENGIAGNDCHEALKYYEKSQELGNRAATNYISECKSIIERGGFPVQQAQTGEQYEQLALDAECNNLPHACAYYYVRGAKLGNPSSMRGAALCYLEGNGIAFNPAT